MAYRAPLPTVIEFNGHHHVTLEKTKYGTRVVTSVGASKYPLRKMSDLPFVNVPNGRDTLAWWCFPKAANQDEARARGKYFWEEFVRYARGPNRSRPEDSRRLLGYILADMPHAIAGQIEAEVFRQHLAEATVAHFRVGLDDVRTAAL